MIHGKNKTVLLATYIISPYKGSESSVSWNYILNMSKEHRLIVLYGEYKEDIEHYLQSHGLTNVKLVNIKPFIRSRVPAISWIIHYVLYKKFHKEIYKQAKIIMETEKIDLIHYLNPIGFKEPGFLWKLNKPYIWGPIKGVDNRPFQLYKALNFKEKIDAITRRVFHNVALYCSPRVRKAIKRADVVFSAVPNTQKQLKKIFQKKSIYLPENGILKMETNLPVCYDGSKLNIIWVGRIDDNKALIILLEALKKIHDKPFCLHVVGEGRKQDDLKNFVTKSGFSDKVVWYGKIDRVQVQFVFKQSHLHVITSLCEATTTVIWEAMANAVPTMSLDHCGMSGVICEKCGIKIAIKSYNQVITDMEKSITSIIETPSTIKILSEGVHECSKNFMWGDRRVKIFSDAYDLAIANYKLLNSN